MLDMFIVMLVPILIRNFYPQLMNFINAIMNANRADETAYERIIEHRKNSEYWWSSDEDGPSNTILQKAVINYINSKADVLRTLPKADYQIKNKAKEEKKNMTGEDEETPADTNESQVRPWVKRTQTMLSDAGNPLPVLPLPPMPLPPLL